jgi:hypothetical protein
MNTESPFGKSATTGNNAKDSEATRLADSPASERELTDAEIAAVAGGANKPPPPPKPGDGKL